jgi:methylmalonyl-CoA/ethylmalonyl-CoA epimerase
MQLRLHHVGIAVADVREAAATYISRFGYELKTEVIHDPCQTAYVQFLQLPGDNVYVELVAPDRPDSKLSEAVKRGGGLNHLCYTVEDIDDACRELRASGLLLIQAPVAAVAFAGRRIAWLVGPDRIPTELVEYDPQGL